MNSERLGRSFSINVDIKPCAFKMVIAIEKIREEISLVGYKWGTSETISLFGFVTLTYVHVLSLIYKKMQVK